MFLIVKIIRNRLKSVSCFPPFSLTGSSGDEIEMPKRRRSSLTANLPLSPPSYVERLKVRLLFNLIFFMSLWSRLAQKTFAKLFISFRLGGIYRAVELWNVTNNNINRRYVRAKMWNNSYKSNAATGIQIGTIPNQMD